MLIRRLAACAYSLMALKVYGIPNCGTCKKAIAWLEDQGIAYEFIDTKDAAPDKAHARKMG